MRCEGTNHRCGDSLRVTGQRLGWETDRGTLPLRYRLALPDPVTLPRLMVSFPPSRRFFFVLTASFSAALRSTWDALRGPPACNKQRSPGPTPQVGQGTERPSFDDVVVNIGLACDKTRRKNCPIWYTSAVASAETDLSLVT